MNPNFRRRAAARTEHKGDSMKDAMYCICTSQPRANAILTHLRNDGFGTEISVFLHDRADTKEIAPHENAVRGVEIGVVAGALVALLVPGLGPVLAIGPLLAMFNGAIAGGVVGGMIGGTGVFKPLGLPEAVADRLHSRVSAGDILIGVHTDDPPSLEKARRIFNSEGAEHIYHSRQPVPLEAAS
jgi:hypothetical protein